MEMRFLAGSPPRHRGHGDKPFASCVFFTVASVPLWFGAVAQAGAQAGVQSTAHGQIWEVHADTGRVTVGDTVGIRFRVQLDERDLLFDTIPRPVDSVLDGVRILSVEKLRRLPNRDFVGRATLAFYRTGPQPVPVFALPFMRAVKGLSNGMVRSDTLSIEVVPTLPAGNPTLRDIRELEPSVLPRVVVGALAAVALALGLLGLRRHRRTPHAPTPAAEEPEIEPIPPPPDPYAIAVGKLGEIERAAWPSRGDVARHYAAVTDALRDYLEAAEGIPARERTTAELLWSLPPRLLEGALRPQYVAVFDEADLVKFARRRPDIVAARDFLAHSRLLLERWHAVRSRAEVADAVR